MRNIVSISSVDRVPVRDSDVPGETRLIDIFINDNQIVMLLRHLYRVHDIVTLGELDAAGWNIINTYPGKLGAVKRRKFFHTIGKSVASDTAIAAGGASIIKFELRSALG